MKGYQIAEKLSQFGGEVYKSLAGIVAIDQIPKVISEHSFIVSNLSTSEDTLGSHWIVLSNQGEPNKIEVFDPLGLYKKNKSLFNKYLPFKAISINEYKVQSASSSSCSKFCIYYICNRTYNRKSI